MLMPTTPRGFAKYVRNLGQPAQVQGNTVIVNNWCFQFSPEIDYVKIWTARAAQSSIQTPFATYPTIYQKAKAFQSSLMKMQPNFFINALK
jgi:hypothetical protein